MKVTETKMNRNMKKTLIFLAAAVISFISCDRWYDTPLDDDRFNAGINDVEPKYYLEQYDPIADKGQFWHPDRMANLPQLYYELYATSLANRNDPNVPNGSITAGGGFGLQYHLLCQSFAGINDRAVAEGKIIAGAWMDAANGVNSYKNKRNELKIAPNWIVWTFDPMTNPGYLPLDGGMMDQINKTFVLTDVVNNPESGIVAVVASHVYESVIVDVRDRQYFEDRGYTMIYDATKNTTRDSWNEFKDKCDNSALVVMPVHTGELADFAIANGLFVINLNKKYNTAEGGQNTELFKEVLAWLKPNSPVYGWEPGVGEDVFVKPVSESGNMMVATADFNIPYFSNNYKNKQKQLLANVINPQDIDYSKPGKFVSFYLSDGPHLGWAMNGLYENYISDANTDTVKMSFGVTMSNLCQMDPTQFEFIMNSQPKNSTYIESFGGGYWYSDDFGKAKNRPELLKSLAEKVAAHMRQHRVKVLEQIAHDPKSAEAIEAYQAFVDANDQLEGIIAIQYAPSYAAGSGDILWVTNKAGYDIPVITVRYSIWNFGAVNQERDGTPAYVAHKLNSEPESSKFSSVIVHAWSNFTDIGDSDDELAENAAGGTIRGSSAARKCADRLDDNINVVNIQELIWRIRMEYRPEQTQKYLSEYF